MSPRNEDSTNPDPTTSRMDQLESMLKIVLVELAAIKMKSAIVPDHTIIRACRHVRVPEAYTSWYH